METPALIPRPERTLTSVVSVLVGALFLCSSVSKAEVLRAVQECPDNSRACVEMELNLRWPDGMPSNTEGNTDPLQHPIVIGAHDVQSGAFDQDYRLAVTGRLNGGPMKEYELLFRGGGLHAPCTDFVQGNIAVLGLSVGGSGIVLTDKGVLDLVDTGLRMGCENCVALLDKDSLELTPRISPTSFPVDERRLVIQNDGNVYWNGERACLALSSGGFFRQAPDHKCLAPSMKSVGAEVVNRARKARVFSNAYTNERLPYDLHEIDGAGFYVFIWGVACT